MYLRVVTLLMTEGGFDEAPLRAAMAERPELERFDYELFFDGERPALAVLLTCAGQAPAGTEAGPVSKAVAATEALPNVDVDVDVDVESGAEAEREVEEVEIGEQLEPEPEPPQRQWREALTEEDLELFKTLQMWRNAEAVERGVTGYIVMANPVLAQVAVTRPRDLADLAALKGIGPAKLAAYGDELLELVHAFENQRQAQHKPPGAQRVEL